MISRGGVKSNTSPVQGEAGECKGLPTAPGEKNVLLCWHWLIW